MTGSYVVTGGAHGIGRALVGRLAQDGHVVALDLDEEALAWTRGHPPVDGGRAVLGHDPEAAQ